MVMEYEPGDYIHRISAAPLLMIVTDADTRVGTEYNARTTDPVDSTVFALAWIGANPRWGGALIRRPWIHYYSSSPESLTRKRVFCREILR